MGGEEWVCGVGFGEMGGGVEGVWCGLGENE